MTDSSAARINNITSLTEETWGKLGHIVHVCHATARRKGWWNKYEVAGNILPDALNFIEEIIASKLMLSVSEHSEALEEIRNGRAITETYYTAEVDGVKHMGTFKQLRDIIDAAKSSAVPKPEGIGIELADVVIRIFDLAEWLKIDLVACIRWKMEYNETREERHGGKKL